MVSLMAVAGPDPGNLVVGAVGYDVLALAVPAVVADPPGQHHLSPILLHLEVERVLLRITQRMEPDGLAALVEDQGRVLARGASARLLFWRDEDVSGRSGREAGVHLDAGRAEIRSRTERL